MAPKQPNRPPQPPDPSAAVGPASTAARPRRGREPGKYAAPALEKGIAVIELLTAERTPQSARRIAERLGLSKSQIFRVLAVLEDHGYIERRLASDDFVITNRLFELGIRTPPVRGLLETALPVMQELANRFGQSCHLTVPNRGHSVVVARTEGSGDLSFAVRLGYRRLLTDSTSGRVLLAFQPAELLRSCLDEARLAAAEPVDEAKLLDALRGIRDRGYEVAASRDVVAITDIACPVIDGARAIACLGVPFLNRLGHRRDVRTVTNAARVAAAAIGTAMRA